MRKKVILLLFFALAIFLLGCACDVLTKLLETNGTLPPPRTVIWYV